MKDHRLMVRLTPEMHAFLQKLAEESGVPMSTFLRKLLYEYMQAKKS